MQDKTNMIATEKEPSSFRLVSALAIAGLISGIVLVATYVYTNPLILANKEAAIQRAIFRVLPDCASYKTFKLEDGKLIEKISMAGSEEKENEDPVIYAGYDQNQQFVGFAVPGSEPGFQDIITAIFGYDGHTESIIGFEVLESKETPGLGDKIFKDAEFQTNFSQLSVKPEILAVKKGEKKNSNEVQAITGATISSKAVVKLLNNTVEKWKEPISLYLEENK